MPALPLTSSASYPRPSNQFSETAPSHARQPALQKACNVRFQGKRHSTQLRKLAMCSTQLITTSAAEVWRAPWPARDALVPLPEPEQVAPARARNAASPYPAFKLNNFR